MWAFLGTGIFWAIFFSVFYFGLNKGIPIISKFALPKKTVIVVSLIGFMVFAGGWAMISSKLPSASGLGTATGVSSGVVITTVDLGSYQVISANNSFADHDTDISRAQLKVANTSDAIKSTDGAFEGNTTITLTRTGGNAEGLNCIVKAYADTYRNPTNANDGNTYSIVSRDSMNRPYIYFGSSCGDIEQGSLSFTSFSGTATSKVCIDISSSGYEVLSQYATQTITLKAYCDGKVPDVDTPDKVLYVDIITKN